MRILALRGLNEKCNCRTGYLVLVDEIWSQMGFTGLNVLADMTVGHMQMMKTEDKRERALNEVYLDPEGLDGITRYLMYFILRQKSQCLTPF